MNPIWFEIPSVVVVLMFVGIVVIRAFTAPVSPEGDRIDIFMRRQLPGASAADAQRTQKKRGR
jgi:hypothetical protein